LLTVAQRHPDFPIVLEAYRECLADTFDMAALRELLDALATRQIELAIVDLDRPSPFAAALLFNYAANYIYEGDAPPAERRAQALSIDHARLRELIGEVELRELIDPTIMVELEAELQLVTPERRARDRDELHDVLLRLGDLSHGELRRRSALGDEDHAAAVGELLSKRRIIELRVKGGPRLLCAEMAARYRDGLGVPIPPGLPERMLAPVPEAKRDLLRMYSRTHGPFDVDSPSERFGLPPEVVVAELRALASADELVEGAFRRGRVGLEWCHPEVLARLRARALAKHRRDVEPVPKDALGRAFLAWHRITAPRRGPDALLDAIEQLQGAPLAFSVLEREILPARVRDYRPADLDMLANAGEIVWQGVDRLGATDGRVALYLTDHFAELQARPDERELGELELRVLAAVRARGAEFFPGLAAAVAAGADSVLDALWTLVYCGLVGNDGFAALRAHGGGPGRRAKTASFRSRRSLRPSAEGRWFAFPLANDQDTTARSTCVARQLLDRFGIVTREVALAEGIEGGFAGSYEIFRAFEDAGRLRRGHFVTGVGTLQFALPTMLDLLRSCREITHTTVAVLSAVDPASPFGSVLGWPEGATAARRMVGARVVVVDGIVRAFVTRRASRLTTFFDDGVRGDEQANLVAHALARACLSTRERGAIREIDGVVTPNEGRLVAALERAGFVRTYDGLRPPEVESGDRPTGVAFVGLSFTPESGSRSAGRTT
jgi:ATP-dependent Lhr-like helicase